MKKLIVAMVVAMAAALTQAATVSWSISGIKDSKGNDMTSGAGYVFCTKGDKATTVDVVTAALAGKSADEVKTYLQNNSITALKGTIDSSKPGYIGVSGVDLASSGIPAATTGVKIFAVIIDDDSFGEDTHYVVTTASSNVKTPAASTSNNAGFSVDASATANSSNWTAAPEPTSGLLLLLGMAGLALKRKRA